MKWGPLEWAAVALAAATAVGLGAYLVVAGWAAAAGPAGVIAAFCELGALVLGVRGRRRAAAARPGRSEWPAESKQPTARVLPDSPGAGDRPKYRVDARKAKIIQIGDGNVQFNDSCDHE